MLTLTAIALLRTVPGCINARMIDACRVKAVDFAVAIG
jgi:hypothetical protein